MRTSKGGPLFIVAAIFGLVLAYPYLGLHMSSSRIDAHGNLLHYSVLVEHIFTATIALMIGPLQFLPKMRTHPRVHRPLGRVYLLAGVVPLSGHDDPRRNLVR